MKIAFCSLQEICAECGRRSGAAADRTQCKYTVKWDGQMAELYFSAGAGAYWEMEGKQVPDLLCICFFIFKNNDLLLGDNMLFGKRLQKQAM